MITNLCANLNTKKLNPLYRRIYSIHTFLKSLSPFWFIMMMTLLSYILVFPLLYLVNTSDMGGPTSVNSLSFIGKIVETVIIAPLIETYISQYLVINLLHKIKKLNAHPFVIIFISAILFGLFHTYSWIYVVFASIIGLLLGYTYIVYEKKEVSPFVMVLLIHALRNSLSVIITTFM